jgi:mitochondrial fission protein ELM1
MQSATIWVLADDRPGNVSQALGVAEALDLPFTVKTIRYNALGKLHNALRSASRVGLEHWSRKAIEVKPPPTLVIAAGRRTAPLARWLKRRYGSRLVQLMDPGWPGRARFDLIAAPLHDDLPAAANVIRTRGACHRATPALLAAEAARWKDRLPDLPRPWTLVSVGGSTATRRFGQADARALIGACRDLPGSLLVVTSRRTGAEALSALAESLPDNGWLCGWQDRAESPYLALLALADQVVVTGGLDEHVLRGLRQWRTRLHLRSGAPDRTETCPVARGSDQAGLCPAAGRRFRAVAASALERVRHGCRRDPAARSPNAIVNCSRSRLVAE